MKCPNCRTEIPEDRTICPKCETSIPFTETTIFIPSGKKTPAVREFKEGTVFARKYEIIEKLSGGGMGIVYRARDIKLNRHVALKFLMPKYTQEQDAIGLFVREAQSASILDHQNICTIHEIDQTSEGQMFISMTYYPGETLKEKMKESPLSIQEALDIGIQIAQGMSVAHKNNIIHRDIKPANIIITDEGIIKIVDFGLAKLADTVDAAETMALVGTLAYMSPEQAQAEVTGYETDVWSIGVLLYEMLTGKPPFVAQDTQSMIRAIVNTSPVFPRELNHNIPIELEEHIMRCLQKHPESRFRSAEDLYASLIEVRKKLEEPSPIVPEDKAFERAETERRLATVMQVNLLGYSRLMEGMDPEEAASYLDEFTRITWSVIRKYGGRTNKITGSNITVYFGVPIAIEDAPKKAVNAAIEIRNGLDDVNSKWRLPLNLGIRVGINTGMVIAGIIGTGASKEYSVTGTTVTVASALGESAEAGQILVGEMTHRYTREDFEYNKLKPVLIKGKKEGASSFELLSTREKIYRPTLGYERMIESQMVGRQNQLDLLVNRLSNTIGGKGSIVSVVGEAGIGKSRLIAEFKRVEGIVEVILLEGRALSIGKNLSFHPIIDMIKTWAGVQELDSPEVTAEKVYRAIQEISFDSADEIFPFVATMMGIKLTGAHKERIRGIEGEALEKLILKNLRDWITKIAEKKSLLIILEDLHWADLTSIEFLESLFRIAESNPVMFVSVFRPDYQETTERLLKTVKERYHTFHSEVVLELLDDSHSEQLLYNLLKIKAIPDKVRELITLRAGGNPYFIEEIVRNFIDEGIVEIKKGRFVLTKKIESAEIPETLSEVLMNRIDKLDEDTRSLLKIASVIGRNFFYKILASVAKAIGELDGKLLYLKEVQLIKERWRMEELEYLFKHALAQEATYESILLKQRKLLHKEIAHSIEQVFCDRLHEFYGMLAFHYSKAEELDKAEEFMLKAGEEALKSSASSEALNYYREALDIYQKKYGDKADPEKIAMLEKNIALALFNKGRFTEADEFFERVLSFYGEKFPKTSAGMVIKFLWGVSHFLLRLYFPIFQRKKVPSQEVSDFINLFYKKGTALIVADPKRMVIESYYWLKKLFQYDITKIENGTGILSISSGTFSYSGISFAISRKIQKYAEDKVDQSNPKAVMYDRVADALIKSFSGDWDNLPDYDKDLVERCIKVGEFFYTVSLMFMLGLPSIARGDQAKANELIDDCHEISIVLENDFANLVTRHLHTYLLIKYMRLPEALQAVNDNIEFTSQTGYGGDYCYYCSHKMRLQILIGDNQGAEKTLKHLISKKFEFDVTPYNLSTFFIAQFLLTLLELEKWKAKGSRSKWKHIGKRARKYGHKAVKNTRAVAYDRTEAYRLMGVYYWIIDKQRKALKWWDKSLKEAERLRTPIDLSRTYMEVGKRLLENKGRYVELNGIAGKQYLEKAEKLFLEFGLSWDLEQLKKLTAIEGV
jgi:serine/threonine protein kinase/tetratricopeptide (TPR) repeat protein